MDARTPKQVGSLLRTSEAKEKYSDATKDAIRKGVGRTEIEVGNKRYAVTIRKAGYVGNVSAKNLRTNHKV